MKLLDQTLGICETCSRVMPVNIIEKDKKVFLESNCCEHKIILHDNNAQLFKKLLLTPKIFRGIKRGEKAERVLERMKKNLLVTQLYLTPRCNLSCPICYNQFMAEIDEPSLEEIMEMIESNDSQIICLTGGEPTCREDLPEIIREITKKGKRVGLYTNGLRLLDLNYLLKLKRAGLKKVYLSFDGFKEEFYVRYRGAKLLEKKLKVLENLRLARMPTCLLCVIIKEANEDQILPVVKFACENRDFVELVWFGGLFDGGKNLFTKTDIYKLIASHLNIPLDYFVEQKKLRSNFYNLLGKFFGKRVQSKACDLLSDGFNFRIKELRPAFSLEELKRINPIFAKAVKQSKLKAILTLLKNCKKFSRLIKLGIFYLAYRLEPGLAQFFRKKEGMLKIWIGEVSSPFTTDCYRYLILGEGKVLLSAYNGGKGKKSRRFIVGERGMKTAVA
jgi:organic radical activating enzyme